MNFSMLHPADQIVMIMKRLYSYQMTTTSGGNLSIMDDEGVMWISPSGVDKGNLTAADIMKVMPDGTIIGQHKPSSEYPFHLAIYRARPDLRAVLHAHPPALVAFSLIREIPSTNIIPNCRILCPKVAMAKYAVPGSEELGAYIAEEFKKDYDIVMLENHGVVIGSDDLFTAFMEFETLDYVARIQINAHSITGSDSIRLIPEKHMELYREKSADVQLDRFVPSTRTSEELSARKEMCQLIHRAYDNNLFTSSQGAFSRRLSDGSFLITPHDKDRKYLEPEDLVLFKGGLAEFGKAPSHSFPLHQAIYAQSPEINSVILAEPPHIMAFAITDVPFDAKLIPESYIMLKNVRKFPFGSSFMQPAMLARELSMKEPIAIIENDCVIACGTSLLNAFDRLEVMEYSARAVVDTIKMGREIVAISPKEIRDIEVAFNL
ncbi:MAG: class II aldolase/adducin family protein [Ruminococcaceae bacterium]|nr:class II aldolase/adducin family protein [Oscillospiraceae bacterium]